MNFSEFKLNKQLLKAIDELGFITATPIQKKVIPAILAGHDVLGIAQTGTGKTAAFVLPILMMLKFAQGEHPRCLILVPTKELVLQLNEHISWFAKYTDLRSVSIYGGVGPEKQIREIEKGVDIIVATPGRFLDIYAKGKLFVKSINTLILDEADKMINMGFLAQLNSILEKIPHKKRQNLLFSATMSLQAEQLSEDFLIFPQKIEIAPQSSIIGTIKQYFYFAPNLKAKTQLLEYFFHKGEFKKTIVFVRKKETANNIFKFLSRKFGQDKCRVVHSNKSQNSRINAIEEFRSGKINILITTDVSARGHDIANISHVINFELPLVYEEYVHRVGRTGRAGCAGVAISIVNKAEKMHLTRIEKLTKTPIEEIKMPDQITVEKTSKQELLAIEREIDNLKKREDPNYKGAFHDKKRKTTKKPQKRRFK